MNALTFGDQAFLARAAQDWNPAYPLGLSGLNGWWKADSFNGEVDGQLVGSVAKPWVNLGGGGNAQRVSPACNYKTNIIGSMPVVRFDGSNLGNPLAFTEVTYAGDFTILVAWSVRPSQPWIRILVRPSWLDLATMHERSPVAKRNSG